MTFERPDAWWLLALAAPIVALHLHHRRRRVVEVSSVELWRGLVEGSAGRGRFRSLRDSLALAFLLAALVAFTGAAAGPVTGTAASGPRALTIVIDGSPTMNAAGVERTNATDALRRAMEADQKRAPQDEIRVWLAAGTPHLWVEPTKNRRSVEGRWFLTSGMAGGRSWAGPDPIAGLAPPCLAETLRLAARTARGGTVLVLTDAVGAESLRDLETKGADLRVGVVDAGRTTRNAGIVACDVDPTDATKLVVRVETTDGAPVPRMLVVTCERVEPLRQVPAELTMTSRTPLTFDATGVATATVALGDAARTGGLIEASLEPSDDFREDDTALLVLPATKPLSVAVVSDKPSPFLVEALRAMPDVVDPAKTTLVTPGAPASSFDGADVVIAEGTSAPAGKPSLTFVGAGARVAEKPLLWGVGMHAVLAGVDLSPLRIDHAVVLDPAAGETSIVASAAGAVGVAGERDGVRHVTFGFRPDASTLPLEAAFPLLVRNSLRWLAKPPAAPRYVVAGEPWPDGDGALVPYPAPGGPYVVRTPTGAETVVRWVPPKGFRLSPATPSTAPSAADVVASLPDRSHDVDTRQRHAPWLAAVGAALLAIGAALLPKARAAARPNVPAPSVELVASR